MTVTKTGDTAIARRRKEQVLEAAADCFRREGFHRTSMSQISAAAGMSSGHIYHFFGSKEAIVEAIVARERSELELLIEKTKESMQHTDVVSAIVETTSNSIVRYMDGGNAALKMEILAEMTRNSSIAELVERTDHEVFGEFYTLLGSDSPETISRCEIASALLEGLSVRAVRNPHLSAVLDRDMVRKIIRYILTH
ncbi:TetR/AcrR family transcriptional regulator [Citrobacter freundii]|uniref:TetR/AcrR family transcriptional regulator n=1 Tax=Citrobacter TaxID=544 RepID=UPI000C80893D|nr:TetR/AcrR family transcriptional regulator [Citrobacter freundii]EMB4337293.1 TetR/AcrR family transcriptional regulator [Citrobacter freundii]MBJ9041939.1 TetR/AcrR family transcriptional regulator [Citrobacter freundii]NTY76561.1 TetR/AcrR family transcriptional regulator [Citrobacter freundii]NUA13009.1 TetR/AcrR family transcriptional regulator [Citrobacter freundii]PMD03436.1 TetR family transcriptional regulator [Citrobacter freundii]